MKANLLSYFVVFLLFNGLINAQTPVEKPQEPASSPIELPNFIIEGKEQVSVQAGGVKQFPEKPQKLSKKELDSINSLEKQITQALPPKQLPTSLMKIERNYGYVEASFGRFNSPALDFGYEYKYNEYSFFGNLGTKLSEGHVDDAGYKNFFLNLNTEYLAPEKYLIFGGSSTRGSISLNNTGFNLYGLKNATKRNNTDFNLGVDCDGLYEGYKFKTGASYNMFFLSQDSADGTDNSLRAYLQIDRKFGQWLFGVNSIIDFHAINGSGVHFIQANAKGVYSYQNLSTDIEAGFQEVANSFGKNRFGIFLDGKLNYEISKIILFQAGIELSFDENSLFNYIKYNPYINSQLDIDFNYKQLVKAKIYFRPDENISISAGLKIGKLDNVAVFSSTDSTEFTVNYQKAQMTSMSLEASWQATDDDNIVANVTYSDIILDMSEKSMPYNIPAKFSINYRRNWFGLFGTDFGAVYIDKRFVDIENKVELEGYLNLNIGVNYKLMKNFEIFGRLENLTNSDIIIWNGYKERGFFAQLGVIWQF